MTEEVKKLGELFKMRREELNLSLKEVENSTSIRTSYLDSIENGVVDQFISTVYFLGFVKQYAVYLGLDPEKIAADFPLVFNQKGEKHSFDYGIGTLEVRGSQGGGVKWLPNLVWAAVSAGLLVIAWYFAKYMGVI